MTFTFDPSMSNVSLRLTAESYIRAGFRVLPLCFPDEQGNCGCGRGQAGRDVRKAPLIPHGLKDATGTLQGVGRHWSKWSSANIGLVTDGLAVLDFDPEHHGFESKGAIEAIYGPLPPTRVIKIGGGGEHWIYRSNGNHLKNAVRLGGHEGVDFKAPGGYKVAPPRYPEPPVTSTRNSGNTRTAH